jgi:3-oxoacyl-[acyl-carrier protein] reductase
MGEKMFEGIKGKKVLITGASTGIGAAIAELFAKYGALVGIHYNKSRKEALALREKIVSAGGKAEVFKADLLKKSERATLVKRFTDAFGGIDVLVNNAGGVYGPKEILDLDETSWDKTFALNTAAPFFLARDAFLHMKSHGGGRIINISSISAKYGGSPTTIHYGAAKAALDAVTKGLARAGAPYNILVNSVRGGVIDTPFHEKILRDRKNLEERIKLIPLKRMGKPIEMARMVLFLASEAGDYITGEIFTVAGGD